MEPESSRNGCLSLVSVLLIPTVGLTLVWLKLPPMLSIIAMLGLSIGAGYVLRTHTTVIANAVIMLILALLASLIVILIGAEMDVGVEIIGLIPLMFLGPGVYAAFIGAGVAIGVWIRRKRTERYERGLQAPTPRWPV